MIRALFILFFVLLQGDSDVISWHESTKLSWINFQDQPNYKIDAAALTASGITFNYAITRSEKNIVSFKAQVHAHFYPEKSWYKPGIANNYILSHEQLHFNITELHARIFRQEIAQLKVSNTVKSDIDNIYDSINKRMAKMQDNYDDDSDYSRNPEQQAIWESFITNELNKLVAYKSK